jgi:hypothetical protein
MELITATITNIQARPYRRLASKMTGFSTETANVSTWLVPQPVSMASVVNTKKKPISVIENSTARGRDRRGFSCFFRQGGNRLKASVGEDRENDGEIEPLLSEGVYGNEILQMNSSIARMHQAGNRQRNHDHHFDDG